MNYYFLLLLSLFIITIIWGKLIGFDNLKQNKKYLITIFVILTLFLTLKSENVGVDAKSYKEIFYDISKMSFLDVYSYDRYEIGYKYFCKLISMIWSNYQFFLCIVSIIEMIGFYYFIKNYSKNYIFSLFIFVTFDPYIFTFGILRQAISLSLLLLSVKFLKENKLLKYIMLVIFASLFHKTALIFLLLYPLKYIKLNKNTMIIFSIAVLLLFLFGDVVINFILSFIYKPANTTFHSGSGYKLLILLYCLSLFAFDYKDKLKNLGSYNLDFIKFLMLGTMIQSLSPTFENTGRITLYFFPFLCIIVSNLLEVIKNIKLTILMFIVLSIYFYIKTNNLFYELLF